MTDLSFGVIFITTLTATGLLLGWRIGNLLTARLNVLRQGIMQVREGNLTSRLDMPPEQELADLTENFNSMTEELDSYRQQVANNQERLEQQVAEACEKLELSHRKLANAEKMAAVGELAGSVAHEISNPLTSIHIRAQLLLESVDDALSKKGLEDIIDQSFRCQVTLRGLVSYASQSGSQRTNIQVKNMLSRCAAVAMPHCDKMPNPEEVKLSIPANLPPVKGDPSQLEHVFICLLDFACTVRAEGTEIEVSAEESEGMIEIVITARARSTTAEPLQPTNGLALCKALIQDHRGTLEETIDEQNGWRWITRLPLNR